MNQAVRVSDNECGIAEPGLRIGNIVSIGHQFDRAHDFKHGSS